MATQLLQDLRALNRLFARKATHTKNAFAKSRSGLLVDEKSRSAVCWCLSGGITKVCKDFDARIAVQRTVRAVLPPNTSIISFNDSALTSFSDVKVVIRKAIAFAKKLAE